MRFAIPVLFFVLGFLVLQSWFSHAQQLSPEREAISFLKDLKSGNANKIVRHFGTNVCHCPKTKGWGAYLAYETDEEPNLAFLFGNAFNLGLLYKTPIASSPQARHGVPWEDPEDYLVAVPLNFDKNEYSPFFIPLATAYGKAISEKELQEFLAHPDIEASKSFTLRLRKELKTGAIKFNGSNIDQDVRGEFKFLDKPNKSATEQSKSWYLAPKDAGNITMTDGAVTDVDQISYKFPRLKKTIIQLRVVRSAKLQPWTIADFAFKNSILEDKDGKILVIPK